MTPEKYFHAIHSDDNSKIVTCIDGPFNTQDQALENAFLNCCTGEFGDPVFDWKKAKKDEIGRFVAKSKGRIARVSVTSNAGALRSGYSITIG